MDDTSAWSLARPITVTVRPETPLDDLSRYLLAHHATCAAVADDEGELLGFVSMTDLVREHAIEGQTHRMVTAAHHRGLRRRALESRREAATTREIMMPFVLTLDGRASVAQAAAVMAARGVHQLVIIDRDGRAGGVLHARDVLRWFARQEGVTIPDDRDTSWRAECQTALTAPRATA
ncbi:MAG TPA: CBS domain-containing protein [Labilithrix sp.]|jgi:CBS domain-containing protein